jgi:transposase
VITALVVEQQTVAEVAARYGVHRSWMYRLKARYDDVGEAAFEPRSRRPLTSPTATPEAIVELIRALRKELAEAGLDAGPDTIAWHLAQRHQLRVSESTVSRTLTRQGLVVPEPKKRPRSSYLRFQTAMPNECWQSDFTHYWLRRPDGTPIAEVEIISWLDDCTRYALHVTAHPRISTSGAGFEPATSGSNRAPTDHCRPGQNQADSRSMVRDPAALTMPTITG